MFLPILLLIPNLVDALNIIFYASVIGQSHVSFLKSATDSLVKRGHNVDIVYVHFNDLVKISQIEGIHRNYTYGYRERHYWKKQNAHLTNTFTRNPRNFIEFENFDKLSFEMCKIAIEDQKLLEFIKSGNYDIGVTNDYEPCGTIMLKAGGVRSIASLIPTPMFQSQVISAGLPTPPSLYGTTLYPQHDGSLYDRLFYFLRSTYNLYVTIPNLNRKYDSMTRSRFGLNFPKVEELEKNIDIIFVNSNEIIEKPRPISHKIKYIGGIGMRPAGKLSKEVSAILDRPSKGVIIFSFGTQVPTKTIPIEIRRNFVNAFRQFPEYNFLWKYDSLSDDSTLFENAPNIQKLKWLPQTDLLGDPRVKLFISHMGLNSFLETSFAGVPVLSIPLFIDQEHNALNAASRGIGTIVNRDELTVENLTNALRELLENPKYSENAKKIAKMMRDKPEKAEKVFAEWLEYVAENPGFHEITNLPGATDSPFWYYSGDSILLTILIMLTTFLLIKKLVKFVKPTISFRQSAEKLKPN